MNMSEEAATYDLISDIHGYADELVALLEVLGHRWQGEQKLTNAKSKWIGEDEWPLATTGLAMWRLEPPEEYGMNEDVLEPMMTKGRWHSRPVTYWGGRWRQLRGQLPQFKIDDFRVSKDRLNKE